MKNFGKIISDKDVITKEYLDSKGYISAITSKMVTDALGFTPFDSAVFTNASIKNALGIADWALAASKPSYDDVYLKLAGGTINGNLTVSGQFKAQTSLASVSLLSNIFDVNASLKIQPKWNLYLNGEAIMKWSDLKSKITYLFSEIGSKPTSLAGYGITDALVLAPASEHRATTDNSAFTTYSYGDNGWKTAGPALAFPNGSYKGLIQISIANVASDSTTYTKMFIGSVRPDSEGGQQPWVEVLTEANIGVMAMSVSSTILSSSYNTNDIIVPGAYYMAGVAGAPAGDGALLVVSGKNRSMVGQVLCDYNGHLYSRIRNNGTWRDWRKIVDDNNISTYTYTKSSIDATFLKLAGGTMAANARITNPADNGTAIYFGASNMFGSLSLPTKLRGSSDPIVATASGEYTILHSGNIGTTSLPKINLNGWTISNWNQVRMGASVLIPMTGTQILYPNEHYTYVETLTSSSNISFTLADDTSGVSVTKIYYIVFQTGSTTPTFTFNRTLYWKDGKNLTALAANKRYRIVIDKDLAILETYS